MKTGRTGYAKLLLFSIIALRSTSLLFATKGLTYMGPLSMNGFRFPLAALFLFIVFRKELRKIDKSILIHGSIIGFYFLLTMALEVIGLKMTNSSTTSFLENMAIIFVPLVNAVLIKRMPQISVLVSAFIAFIGVGLLTLKGGRLGISIGELICILSAVAYTAAVISTDRYSKREDPLLLGIVQVGFIAVASYILAAFVERPDFPTAPVAWGVLLFLAVVCTCFGFTFQPVAQSRVSTETAGLFCAFNPLITAVLGYVFLGERLGTNGLIGGALIMLSIIIPVLASGYSKNKEHI